MELRLNVTFRGVGSSPAIEDDVARQVDKLERRLQEHARRCQGAVKAKDVPMRGRIAKLIAEEVYGFIRTSDGREAYFHRNAVVDGAVEKLKTDQEVRLVIAEGEGGKGPQASTVKPIGKHHLVGLA